MNTLGDNFRCDIHEDFENIKLTVNNYANKHDIPAAKVGELVNAIDNALIEYESVLNDAEIRADETARQDAIAWRREMRALNSEYLRSI